MDVTRPRRADARRNAERLLTAADAAFRKHGAGASLERIAREAGVAVGTLYGHFPDRLALVAALLRERHETLFARGEELGSAGDPGAALRDWTHEVVAHCATYRGLAGLVAAGSEDHASALHVACRRLSSLTEVVVDRARTADVVATGTTADDVMTLATAAAWIREQRGAEASARLVNHALIGLRDAPGRASGVPCGATAAASRSANGSVDDAR